MLELPQHAIPQRFCSIACGIYRALKLYALVFLLIPLPSCCESWHNLKMQNIFCFTLLVEHAPPFSHLWCQVERSMFYTCFKLVICNSLDCSRVSQKRHCRQICARGSWCCRTCGTQPQSIGAKNISSHYLTTKPEKCIFNKIFSIYWKNLGKGGIKMQTNAKFSLLGLYSPYE